MLSGTIGILHFAVSLLSLLTGTLVLRGTKGTQTHKRIGYVYAAAMLVVLVTSFMLYNLHGTFGVLHWLAVLSSVTLLAGMVPMWLRRPKTYIIFHFSFMYWSVIGLYCAFVAEVFTRLPMLYTFEQDTVRIFYLLVGVATALTGGIGSVFFRKYKERWSEVYGNY